jgi:hypothetical protein
MPLLSGGISNACCGISKSIAGRPHLNLALLQLNFSGLILKDGIAKIFFAKKKFKGGTGNASIVSGIESRKN